MIPFKTPVKFGLISGSALIVLTVLLYALDVDLFSILFSIINGLVVFGLMIVMTVMGINKLRDEELDKKITYVQALLGGFVIILIAMYLNNIFNYILTGIIDTQYMPNKIDSAISKYEDMGMSEEQMGKVAEQFEELKDATAVFIKALWTSPIASVVIAAIVAAFIKKDKTEQIPL